MFPFCGHGILEYDRTIYIQQMETNKPHIIKKI